MKRQGVTMRLWALSLAWLPVSALAQATPEPIVALLPVPPAVTIVTDDAARMSVPVTIAGRQWRFLIDTASTRSVIASDIADSMGLVKGAVLQVLNIAGRDAVPSVIIPDLGFSDLVVRNIAAPALLRCNLGGDGLLGLDILHNSRVSIDFAHDGAMTIAPSTRRSDPTSRETDAGTIVVVGRSRMGELIVTDAEINGIAVAVVLDTGSETSIANPVLAQRLRRGTRKPLTPVTLLSVTGRTLSADHAIVHQMRIGGVTIANVPMVFADIATFRQFGLARRPAILLGMETLRSFARISIDFPRRQVRFLLPRDTLKHFHQDWAPAWIRSVSGAGLEG